MVCHCYRSFFHSGKNDWLVAAGTTSSYLIAIHYSAAQLWGYSTLLIVIVLVYRNSGFKGLRRQSRLVSFLAAYGIVFSLALIPSYEVSF